MVCYLGSSQLSASLSILFIGCNQTLTEVPTCIRVTAYLIALLLRRILSVWSLPVLNSVVGLVFLERRNDHLCDPACKAGL